MNGLVKKVEYEGDWAGFFALAQKTLKLGGSLLYWPTEKKGLIVEPDGTKHLAVNLKTRQVEEKLTD